MLWAIVQELIYGKSYDAHNRPGVEYAYDRLTERPIRIDAPLRKALVAHCRTVLANGPKEEQGFAASVLVSSAIGRDHLVDGEFEKLFGSEHPSVWRWAALALANFDRLRLIELSPKRCADEQLDLLFILGRSLPKQPTDAETAFWLSQAKRIPSKVAYVMRVNWPGPVPVAFRQPIRAWLIGEIDKPTVMTNSLEEYELESALELLNRWGLKEDTPLLKRYLKHPCRSLLLVGPAHTKYHRYTIRKRVATYIEKRGHTVPADTVFREPVK